MTGSHEVRGSTPLGSTKFWSPQIPLVCGDSFLLYDSWKETVPSLSLITTREG